MLTENISSNDWKNLIDSYEQSGLSAVKWSEQNNLSVHKLRYWQKKFKRQTTKETLKEQQWVSIPMKQKDSQAKINVKIGSFCVEVQSGFNKELLIQVLDTMQILEDLLPWSEKLPECFKVNKKNRS